MQQIRQQELELPPDPEVAALAERIRRGELAPPPAATPPAPPRGGSSAARRTPVRRPALPSGRSGAVSPRDAVRRCAPAAWPCVLPARRAARLALDRSGRAPPRDRRRLAVLPFENLGDSADAYFADGVTDELRGKLAAVPGLEVVASLSSNDYRGSTRRLPEIARELGVDYLLIGKIRWQRGAAGSSRVRVSPELIRLAPGTAPTTRWQQPIDAALTDVFAVQADIAAKVADALGVVLGDSARRELTVKPTESLAAYDEYLKGEAAVAGHEGRPGRPPAGDRLLRARGRRSTRPSRRRGASSPAPAPRSTPTACPTRRWASRRGSRPSGPARSGRRIRWSISPLGDFYGSVNPIDNERAVAAYERGLRLAPDDVDLLERARERRDESGAMGRRGGAARRARRNSIPARLPWRAGWPRCTSSSGSTPRRTRRPTGRSRSRRPVRRWSRSR